MNSEIKFYISILLRRLPLAITIAAIGSVAAVFYALTRPAVYQAEALLLVESPQIPGELAASTVSNNAPEQLEIIEQRLLTRANLIDIANDLNVFPDRNNMAPDEVVDAMRARSDFRASFGRDRATLLEISFDSENPDAAARVVNEYVTRMLQANVELRTSIAEQTLDFFEQEVDRLGEDLARQGARILDFKNRNIDALPESLTYRQNRQSVLLERRSLLERDKEAARERRERLMEVYQTTGRVVGGSEAALSPEQQELRRLERELANALVVYSEQNPRVRVLQGRIDQLRSEVTAQAEVDGAPAVDTGEAILNLQLSEIDAQIEFVDEQLGLIEEELAQIGDAIERTPSNAITIEALERDYANIQAQYNSAVARLAAAATGERIELTAKGQRISVLRQAVPPREPASPNRRLIIAAGVMASFGAAGALIFLLELLNRSVRRPADLTKALGITPLATVPYIPSPGEVTKRRGFVAAFVLAVALGIPAALYYVHVEYLPLDLLADRALGRLGL